MQLIYSDTIHELVCAENRAFLKPKSADRRALAPPIHNVDLFFSFQSGLTEQEGTRVPFFNHFLSEKWTYNGRASRLGHASADFGRTNP
jgi:hypothetical protein